MTLITRLTGRFYAFFTASIRDEEMIRRVILLVNLSLVGGSVTLFFGCVAFYAGNIDLAVIDFLGAICLTLNMVLLRKYPIKSLSIYIGLGIMGNYLSFYLDC